DHADAGPVVEEALDDLLREVALARSRLAEDADVALEDRRGQDGLHHQWLAVGATSRASAFRARAIAFEATRTGGRSSRSPSCQLCSSQVTACVVPSSSVTATVITTFIRTGGPRADLGRARPRALAGASMAAAGARRCPRPGRRPARRSRSRA